MKKETKEKIWDFIYALGVYIIALTAVLVIMSGCKKQYTCECETHYRKKVVGNTDISVYAGLLEENQSTKSETKVTIKKNKISGECHNYTTITDTSKYKIAINEVTSGVLMIENYIETNCEIK